MEDSRFERLQRQNMRSAEIGRPERGLSDLVRRQIAAHTRKIDHLPQLFHAECTRVPQEDIPSAPGIPPHDQRRRAIGETGQHLVTGFRRNGEDPILLPFSLVRNESEAC